MQQNIIYQGNSVISVETHPEYTHPVVIKKPSKRHPSQRSLRSLEKEYEMLRSLNAVEGVRKAWGQKLIENQPIKIEVNGTRKGGGLPFRPMAEKTKSP